MRQFFIVINKHISNAVLVSYKNTSGQCSVRIGGGTPCNMYKNVINISCMLMLRQMGIHCID